MKGGNILSLFPRSGHGIMPNGIVHLSAGEYGFENESRRVRDIILNMPICLTTSILPYIP